ncbi:glutamyl-tRNA synthetase [Pricia antarctica]|uniref:Glutamate--tRNA ligase n=1 Tax=Pricia antarctica TaxID=641691 RepID=A0A1G6X4N8_9FLAO|nr:glutamate--tRNA ligase [Pricia antarctica]SDD73061.1 glutamyl-tRNA synthetase [Pricia antarctica]
MNEKIRVRFAPSPTGPLHIGGVRTALFNYLFAKKHGGVFILRIEDTDRNRYVEGAEQYIIDALNWCGIPYDEGPGNDGDYGPYRQSERKHLYKKYAQELIDKGKAYYAFDTAEKLDQHRKNHEAKGKTFIYNWHNRLKLDNSLSLLPEEVQKRLDAGEDYVIRFLTPPDETLYLKDTIRGAIEIDTNTLDDKVLFKSDGMPTYHLANIVDDHLMEISHVIRGEEWLPSLALHQQLYHAFGWDAPEFAHLPLILKPTGNGKLSKRDGEKGGFPIFPLQWNASVGYREAGYFSEAVMNFLALLGWNPGTEQEIFSLNELVKAFSLDRVNKSGARFDPDKTVWYNHQYLQRKTNKELTFLFMPFLKEHINLGLDCARPDHVQRVVTLIKERASFVSDFWELSEYFFVAPASYNEKAVKKQWKVGTPDVLDRLALFLKTLDDFSSENLENLTKQWITEQELSFGKVMPPLRLVIVGDMKGPHLFDIMGLIGKEESIGRIQSAIASIE